MGRRTGSPSSGRGLSDAKIENAREQYINSKPDKYQPTYGAQPAFKKGGKVKKTGPAKVHKGEYVIKKAAAQKVGTKKLAALNKGKAR